MLHPFSILDNMSYLTKTKRFAAVIPTIFLVAFSVFVSFNSPQKILASSLSSESFSGISTPANAWVSGGSGGSVACLTAASSSASNSIPACSGGPIDTVGNGVLRLTPTSNTRSGFVFNTTPVSASHGLNIAFDMYQYNGSGADGISFFLIDGSANPTVPGASGGSLGYSSGGITPGIVGGYVGIGFDKYGNFSNPAFGSGGAGFSPNTIAVRGSEGTGYAYVTGKVAAGQLANTSTTNRANAKRHVVIFVSTNNIMTVSVDYNDGVGLRTELSNINLNTINGTGTLPTSFKYGFAASTGGSNDTHEISGLTVNTLNPVVGIDLAHSGSFVQGGTGSYSMTVSNSAGGETSTTSLTAAATFPAGTTPTAASGSGWTCGISGQTVTCTSSASLAPGTSAPAIAITTSLADTAASGTATASVTLANNDNGSPTDSDAVTILAGSHSDTDGVFDAIEAASPNSGDANNDGLADASQNSVTSLINSVTGKYAVLESAGCTSNANVGISAYSPSTDKDGSYSYPAGLLSFQLTCSAPGGTATITQYYYGTYDPTQMVMRKYNSTTHTYAMVPGATFSTVSIGGQSALKVVYQVTDGSSLDQDGLANGVIVDPAGPAIVAAVPTPTPTPSVSTATATPSATSTPTATPIVAPNTGLQAVSLLKNYIALGLGLILALGFFIRLFYRAAKNRA